MFINKRKYEELLQRLENKLEEKFREIAGEWNEGSRKLEEIDRSIGQLRTAVQKHDMSMEDLLEKWEDKESERDGIRKQTLEYEQSENMLLGLFESYQEQFWNLKRFADRKDEALSAQMALMEQKLENCRQLCGISIIEECGTEVDYDLHEVIEAVDTAEQDKDKLVAGIINWGYLYKGKVKKKARVTAFRAVKTAGRDDAAADENSDRQNLWNHSGESQQKMKEGYSERWIQ